MEGAFRVWLRGSQVTYFTLKGQARPKRPKHSNHDIDDLSQIKIWTHGEVSLLFEKLKYLGFESITVANNSYRF